MGSAGDSTKESFTTHKFNVLWVIVILCPVDVFVGIKTKTHFAKSVTQYLNYLVCGGPFLVELSQELSPTKQNDQDQQKKDDGVSERQKYAVIDTVTRPYADATATMQETVSRVSSSNFSSIDDDGELFVSSCLGGFSKKQLPSLFPLVPYRGMHGKRRTGLERLQRDKGQTRPRSCWP